MSFNSTYSPILELVSLPRLTKYRTTFKPVTDAQLYGTYIWVQHVGGALYPLLQSLEVTLRNTIDTAARNKFGDFWWDNIACNKNDVSRTRFYRGISEAKNKLISEWEKRERERLGLRYNESIPTTMPVWSHDKIVGATTFSTWQFILNGDFSDQRNIPNSSFLWPQLLGKAFRQYHLFDRNPHRARSKIMNSIEEIRNFRNRVFHHEPFWSGTNNQTTAIDSVRAKINKIETLLSSIDSRKRDIMVDVGLFMHARRVCSLQELNIHINAEPEKNNYTQKQKRNIRKVAMKSNKNTQTSTWNYAGMVFGIHRIR
ncbi:Abi family protein [Methylophaga sp.]|uniref:Abi family protein n=1 Tax=Methylophaga sp. TaxID=2024840 RepID=UPI003A93AD76